MAKVHDHPLKPRKTPYALRLRGSVLSRVWLQILIISLFSTAITCISELTSLNLGIQSTMISTLGFVVGLSLSFRTSSAYANWKEGRQAWEKLSSVARNLSRLIWVHAPDNGSTEDLLRKKSAMNLVSAFVIALKHHLREERGQIAQDSQPLVKHLATYTEARLNHTGESTNSSLSALQLQYLPFNEDFEPHPNDISAEYTVAYGNLPVQISFHLAAYLNFLRQDRALDLQVFGQSIAQMSVMMDAMATCERVLLTPVPVAYEIVVSQLVWVFMVFLPFQLQTTLHWISIPATIVTAAMLFGLAEIGLEIKNPWGDDDNDLDIDRYAQLVALELDTYTALSSPSPEGWSESALNTPIHPFCNLGWDDLKSMARDDVEELLRRKAFVVGNRATDPLSRAVKSELSDKKEPAGHSSAMCSNKSSATNLSHAFKSTEAPTSVADLV